jgi:hypothetical protein
VFRLFALSTAVLVLLLPATLLAHGGKTHVLGTVTAIDANQVEVKTQDGKTTSILLTKATKYSKGKSAAKAADLKVGDRVVVDVTGEGIKLTATDIRIGAAAATESHDTKKHQPAKP